MNTWGVPMKRYSTPIRHYRLMYRDGCTGYYMLSRICIHRSPHVEMCITMYDSRFCSLHVIRDGRGYPFSFLYVQERNIV
ncbi:hypothetical protein GDO78_019857 [Eleutherodactylus coqui]|uniref:Uncharacterized protein n=1 Tax=Eleutherodactylus coqui TaxID=57060 RepID=A0A8J6ECF7_ELECQ|nr:hypothetical protein GDO78_019857 [Eleutherodactylus coqui]